MFKKKINSDQFATAEPAATLMEVKKLVKDGCRVGIKVIAVKEKKEVKRHDGREE